MSQTVIDLIERLGVAAIVAVVLVFCIKWLVSEMAQRDKKHEELLQAEREYSQRRDESYTTAMHGITTGMRDLKEVLILLSERSK